MSNYIGDTTITGSTASGGSTTIDSTVHASKGNVVVNGSLTVDSSGNTTGPAAGRKITGGTGTTADLSFQTTSGVGASGADMHFLVGNNGATEAITILNAGNVGINVTAPTARLEASNAGTVLFRGINTAASSSTAGTAVIAVSNDGAAMASGDRLGFFVFSGAVDGSSTLNNSASVEGYAAEAWSGSVAGAYVTIATAPIGSLTRAERVRVTDVGNVKINGSANRGTTEGTAQLVLFDGTAPVGTLTDGVSFYSASGEARVMDSAGNSTLLSPHDHETNEWIFYSKNTVTGKVLRIDMERMMKALNKNLGGGFIKEYME